MRHAEFAQPASILNRQHARLTSVCMICKRQIDSAGLVVGPAPAADTGTLLSHGVCRACAPQYCAGMGLSKQDTRRVLAAAEPAAAVVHVRD